MLLRRGGRCQLPRCGSIIQGRRAAGTTPRCSLAGNASHATRRQHVNAGIRKAAVLGAGTMGARIAAHLANAGVSCYLLDIVPTSLTPAEQSKGLTLESPAVRNRIVLAGLEAAKQSRPA